MKNKLLSWLYEVIFVVLLIAGVTYPDSWLMNLSVVCLWLANILVWVLICVVTLACLAGGEIRYKILLSLGPVFSRNRSPVSRVYGWVLKLLIVLSLAYTGWLLTLVSYVLTMALYQVCRSAISDEPAAA